MRDMLMMLAQAAMLAACGGPTLANAPFAGDPKNAAYLVDGRKVNVTNGAGTDGDARVGVTNAVLDVDLNADGTTDRVLVLARAGETSTTMHLVALVSEDGRYRAAAGGELGAELVVKSLGLEDDGAIRVNLLVASGKGDDGTKPSKPITKRFVYRDNKLNDVTPKAPETVEGDTPAPSPSPE